MVHKVFYTIQGEGPDAGRPAIFIRLAKCNLRCYFCDTEFDTGEWRSLAELTEITMLIARQYHCHLVVITGGEPLLQNIVPFVRKINEFGIACSVETAGTVFYPQLWELFNAARSINNNLIVCSPKTGRVAGELERIVGCWKYVVKAGEQDEFGLPNGSTQMPGKTVPVFRPKAAYVPVYLNPMDEQDPELNRANLHAVRDACLKHGYTMGVQIHKLAEIE